MFMGEHQHSVDAKGRLAVPAKFREELGDKFVATKGLDACLFVFPMKEWLVLEAKLRELSFTSANNRAFVRFFFSGATEVELDPQGRILLPQSLRDHAKLEKDVMVIGINTRVEIWSKVEWEAYTQRADLNFEEIAEKLIGL